jgi:DNA-binding CsgD family transcriptional regulator/PAS domain-containing protein
MHAVEQLPSLIGDIYDASLDPSRWSAVLVKAADFIGGSAASVYSKDAQSNSGAIYHHGGDIDPHYTHLYFTKYVKFDPSTTAHVTAEIGQPICTADIMTFDELRETRIYQEWIQPQGWVDCLTAPLDKTTTGAALFGIFRREEHGVVDDEARWRMRQIVPHVRRAVLIGRVIERKTAAAATFADTLDGLSAGVFLVDAAGRVVHANASGRALAAGGAAVRVTNGTLVPTDAVAARVLDEVLAAAGHGDTAVGVRGIAVPLTARDGQRYAVHVLPLTSGARRCAGARYAAVAAVLVRKATIEVPAPAATIARHYSLTPSELRVLLANIEVGGVAETADALGIGLATVKTHLHRVFGKTGASRQSDLVKLVAAFANPLVN